jgi:hypothetical protein
MRARTSFGCFYAALTVVGCFAGCTGSDAPIVATEERTTYNPIDKSVGRLDNTRPTARLAAIEDLIRAWKAGELPMRSAEELEGLAIQIDNLAKGDSSAPVRRKARELLALMQGTAGEAAPAEAAPSEG